MTQQREIVEPLVSVVRDRVADTLGSSIGAECLLALTERGVYSIRELPQVAQAIADRYPDLSEIVAHTVDMFARCASLPRDPEEREALERTPGGGLWDEDREGGRL